MPSATLQAITQAPTILPSDQVLSDPNAAEAWFSSLPTAAQNQLATRLTQIVQNAPPVLQLAIQRYIASTGHVNVVPMGVDGMGFYHEVTVAGRQYPASQPIAGLGQWGALISAAAQVGTSLYVAKDQASLAKSLQANSLENDKAIADATLQMQKETQLALINAQTQAAQIAGAASIQNAATYAPVIGSSIKWIGLAVVAVALVGGGGAWFMSRRKK